MRVRIARSCASGLNALTQSSMIVTSYPSLRASAAVAAMQVLVVTPARNRCVVFDCWRMACRAVFVKDEYQVFVMRV